MIFHLLSTFGLARLELYRGEIGIPCDNDHCNVYDEGDIDIKVTLTILVMIIMNIVIIIMMIMTIMRIMARGEKWEGRYVLLSRAALSKLPLHLQPSLHNKTNQKHQVENNYSVCESSLQDLSNHDDVASKLVQILQEKR